MQITYLSVGTVKEAYLRDAVAEYEKRISAFADLRSVSVPETRIADEDNQREVAAALDAEGEKLLSATPRGAYRVALCVEGREMTSEELAGVFREAGDRQGKIVFYIGSSHGLSPKVKAACDLRLSFSRLTFPHQLMRLFLAEATYRSLTILAGKRYHK